MKSEELLIDVSIKGEKTDIEFVEKVKLVPIDGGFAIRKNRKTMTTGSKKITTLVDYINKKIYKQF